MQGDRVECGRATKISICSRQRGNRIFVNGILVFFPKQSCRRDALHKTSAASLACGEPPVTMAVSTWAPIPGKPGYLPSGYHMVPRSSEKPRDTLHVDGETGRVETFMLTRWSISLPGKPYGDPGGSKPPLGRPFPICNLPCRREPNQHPGQIAASFLGETETQPPSDQRREYTSWVSKNRPHRSPA